MRPGAVILCVFISSFVSSEGLTGDSPAYSLGGTYLGGSANDGAFAIGVDRDGNLYVGGQTSSVDFLPIAGPVPIEGSYDAVVVKLAPDGSSVEAVFSFGGPGIDGVWDLAVTEGGDVIVLGDLSGGYVPPDETCSSGTGGGARDIFVARLDGDLGLRALQIIGGSGDDVATDVDVTGDGIVTLLGNTTSRDLATTPGAFQETFQGGETDYFVARLDLSPERPCGERVIYLSYVGSSSSEEAPGIGTNAGMVADAAGLVTIAGRSAGGLLFPHTAAFRSPIAGSYDIVVAQILCDASLPPEEQFRYGAVFGGNTEESPKWVGVTLAGNIQVVGWTWSSDFPATTGTPHRGQNDIFVAEIDPEEGLVISELIGGSSYDGPGDCIARPDGSIVIGGITGGGGFPTTPDALRPVDSVDQAFLVEWRRDLGVTPIARFRYGTALTMGAACEWDWCDRVWDFALGPDGRVHACGVVSGFLASDTERGAQPLRAGGADMFVLALDLRSPEARCAATPTQGAPPLEVCFDASGSSSPDGTGITEYLWDFGDGETLATEEAEVCRVYAEPGRFTSALRVTNDLGLMATADPTPAITIPCPPGDVAPWTAADIGSPIFPGSSRKDGDDILLCAGGVGLVASIDGVHFVHRDFSGDFVLTARIAEVPRWSSQAGLGLMARDGLDASAPYAAIVVEKLTGARQRLRYREAAGANARSRSGPLSEIPLWLRLERSGDLFIARSSADGAVWEEVDRQEIPGMPESLLVGLVAYGKDSGDATKAFAPLEARVPGLAVDGSEGPGEARFIRADANADGGVDISDAVFVLNWLFVGGESPGCRAAADSNGDAVVDISDPTYLLNHLFLGGPAPEAPYPECGVSELEGDAALGCETPPPGCA